MYSFIPDVCNVVSRCILAAGFGVILALMIMGGSGCSTEKVYKISTSCPDVWDEKPSQSVSLIVEVKQ